MGFLARIGLSKAQAIIGVVAVVLIGLAAFAIVHTLDKVADQAAELATVKRDLATEQLARKRDVAGLTVLSQGMLAASAGNAIDERVLSSAIDSKNPSPVSPGLARLLDGLRSGESRVDAATARPGSTIASRPNAGE